MLVENERRSDVVALIRSAYRYFETGDFESARASLDEAHSLDFDSAEIRSALRACGFWQQRLEGLENLKDAGTRGDYLRRQWLHFDGVYRNGFEHPFDEGSARLKRWALSEAIGYYNALASESDDREAMLQAGRCLKAMGRYDECITMFEKALRGAGANDARLFAELADTYSLIGETTSAKALMREALFLDASAVELNEIDSPLFRRLIERLSGEKDENEQSFCEWLPVFGTIWGVLDVTRELSPVEYGKLKQSIYALKSEIADGDSNGRLTPRLINRYFRLIDHYRDAGNDRSLVEEVLMNIKLLSPGIYRTYFE